MVLAIWIGLVLMNLMLILITTVITAVSWWVRSADYPVTRVVTTATDWSFNPYFSIINSDGSVGFWGLVWSTYYRGYPGYEDWYANAINGGTLVVKIMLQF